MGFNASVNSSGVITMSWTGASVVQYDRDFDFFVDNQLTSSQTVLAGADPGTPITTWNATRYGTYTCSCKVTNIDTGYVVASGQKDVTWSKPTPSFSINTPVPDRNPIVAGSNLTISWTYSGSPNATNWYLLGNTTNSRSSATMIAYKAVSGGSLSFTATSWRQVGTWYFWIVCANSNPQTSGTTSSPCTVTVTPFTGLNISVRTSSGWVDNCKIYVCVNNGNQNDWVEGSLDIFHGGWS